MLKKILFWLHNQYRQIIFKSNRIAKLLIPFLRSKQCNSSLLTDIVQKNMPLTKNIFLQVKKIDKRAVVQKIKLLSTGPNSVFKE